MSVIMEGRARTSFPAGLLALLLFCSPEHAVRMALTLRFVLAKEPASLVIGARLGLMRKIPPPPMLAPGSSVPRASDAPAAPALPCRTPRQASAPEKACAATALRSGSEDLRSLTSVELLYSSPQNRVLPPPVPDARAS